MKRAKPVSSTLLKAYRKHLDTTPVMPIIMADFRRRERLLGGRGGTEVGGGADGVAMVRDDGEGDRERQKYSKIAGSTLPFTWPHVRAVDSINQLARRERSGGAKKARSDEAEEGEKRAQETNQESGFSRVAAGPTLGGQQLLRRRRPINFLSESRLRDAAKGRPFPARVRQGVAPQRLCPLHSSASLGDKPFAAWLVTPSRQGARPLCLFFWWSGSKQPRAS